MGENRHEFDAVVVGAGTSGATCAIKLAEKGLGVALLDARSLEDAGYHHINNIPPEMFDAAGIPRPSGAEDIGGAGEPVKFLTCSERVQVLVGPNPVRGVNMHLLTRRLHRMALDAGVAPYERSTIAEVEFRGARPTGIIIESRLANGQTRRIHLAAKLFIDASGMGGALRSHIPALAKYCRPLEAHDICTAAQQTCAIDKPHAALQYLDRIDCRPGEYINQLGYAGGFSTMTIKVEKDLKSAELLTGVIDDGRHGTGLEQLEKFKRREGFTGKVLIQDGGRIPLRRPYDVFVAEGIACVGDAACQVFPAHASGTGMGIVAAKMLASAVADCADPGDMQCLWRYQADFMRTHGAVHASYDLFRRVSQAMSEAGVEKLLSSQLMTGHSLMAGLRQQMPELHSGDMLAAVGGAVQAPLIAARAIPAIMKMGPVYALYRLYPQKADTWKLKQWSRAVARIFGDKPDFTG